MKRLLKQFPLKTFIITTSCLLMMGCTYRTWDDPTGVQEGPPELDVPVGDEYLYSYNKAYSIPDAPMQRTLRSVSLDDLVERDLTTGVYHGSERRLKYNEEFTSAFYASLAAERQYLNALEAY